MKKKQTKTGLIVSGAVFVVGLVLLLIVLLSPVSTIGTYKYEGEMAGQAMTQTYKFGKDEVETTMKVEGQDPISYTYEYNVEDGKLYMKSPLGVFTEICEIDSRKMSMEDDEETIRNGVATAALVVSIVLTALGALGAVTVFVLGKKK